jgi:hypothetical protein
VYYIWRAKYNIVFESLCTLQFPIDLSFLILVYCIGHYTAGHVGGGWTLVVPQMAP